MSGDVVANLVCVATPPGTRTSGLDEEQRVGLRAGAWLRIGASRVRHEVVVRSPNIPNSQASLIVITIDADGRCRARDSGHNFRVRVNDEEVSTPRVLVHGDIVEACFFDKPLGLRFRFESLATQPL